MPSVTKILFRRGLDSQRQLTTLNQGEPGYSTDTKRLFVGDGATAGGTPAGIFNFGAVAALSGNYIYNSAQTNISPTAFNLLSSAEVGDFVYDQASTSIWAVSSTSIISGTTVPILSDFAHLYSTTGYEASQLYYNGTKLTIKDSGVGINQIASSITAGSRALSGGGGGVLDIKPKSIGNTLIVPASNNSVKITNNSGAVSDVIIGANQILGQTNATGSALGAVNLTTTGGLSLSSNANTIQLSVPANLLLQSGGYLTGTLSALNLFSGRFITDVIPTGSNDVVNVAFARTLSSGLITPTYLSSNYYPLTGGTLNGALVGTSYIQATNGFYSTNNYNGSYTDGIVVDYVTGNGRISVGANDAISFYNGGPASTALMTLSGSKVGIGTTTPGSPLSFGTSVVGAPGQANIIRLFDTGSTSYGFGISPSTLNIVSPGNTLFTNNSLSAMYIDSYGNVGIGNTNPLTDLHITNASGDTGLRVSSVSGNNNSFIQLGNTTTTSSSGYAIYFEGKTRAFRINADYPLGVGNNNLITGAPNGYVGINFALNTATLPAYPLDVNGNAHASRIYVDNTPSAVNELTRKDYVDSAFNNAATPPGTVMFFAGTTAPAGWLKANGAVLPQASYPALFAALAKQGNGNTTWWVANDGAANFRLPDLRGQFIRGWNDGIAASNAGSNTLTIPATDAGRSFGDIQADAYKSHTHSITDPGHWHRVAEYAGAGNGNVTKSHITAGTNANIGDGTGTSTTGITINSIGGTETRPSNIALLACIKY